MASASEQSDSLPPSFIETLKQLTPHEAKSLGDLFGFATLHDNPLIGSPELLLTDIFPAQDGEGVQLLVEAFERLGLIRRRYQVQKPAWLENLPFADPESVGIPTPLPELKYDLEFTEYGIRFMKACTGPCER